MWSERLQVQYKLFNVTINVKPKGGGVGELGNQDLGLQQTSVWSERLQVQYKLFNVTINVKPKGGGVGE